MAYNLLKQIKTLSGKLNCYAVDSSDDLKDLSAKENEIIGCRAFDASTGKLYLMSSSKEWHEAILGEATTTEIVEDTKPTISVSNTDENPSYLINKLVAEEGSGIKLSTVIRDGDEKLSIKYSPENFEIDYLETMPFASIQGEDTPTYQSGDITFIASSLISSYDFKLEADKTVFTAYSSSGAMKNCQFLILKINDDKNKTATIIARSKTFNLDETRTNNKIQASCLEASEKIKAGERYYIGIAGTPVTTDWAKFMGYRAWAAQDIEMTPPFNVYATIPMSEKTMDLEDFKNNGSFYVYYSIEN